MNKFNQEKIEKANKGWREAADKENERLLRNDFAKAALPEIIRQRPRWESGVDFDVINQGDADNIAEQAYYIADAMVKESKKS